MACCRSICSPKIPITIADDNVRSRSSWLSRVAAGLIAGLQESARRQVLREFENVELRGVFMELDRRFLRDLGVTRNEAIENLRNLKRK